MKMKRFWNADKIVGISAMVVSIGSLFVIVYQTNLIRREQHASVMPYLELTSNRKHPKHFAIKIENSGLGPALIKELRVHYQDEILEGDLVDFFRTHFSPTESHIIIVDQIRIGELIPANTVIPMLESGDDISYEKIIELAEVLDEGKAVFEIVYASVYGQKWALRTDALVPQEVDD